jgi:uncharacterized repeat protein (TIGR01451 family)
MKKQIFFLGLLALSFSAFSQIELIYSVPGNYIYMVPNNVDSITVECWGAGGSGGNAYVSGSTGGICTGGGGGGGSYSKSLINIGLNTSYDINVGSGGTNGNSGGNSSFGSNIVQAIGGSAGTNCNYLLSTGNGGIGGIANLGIGQIRYSGGNGASPGGGGSSAGCIQNGVNGGSSIGGLAPGCGGNGGNSGNSSSNVGFDGSYPGGGGGGGYINTMGNINGGNGGDGLVKLTYLGKYIAGKVYNDINSNCIIETGELGLTNVDFYISELGLIGETDNNGDFFLPQLPIGNYNIQFYASSNWSYPCGQVVSFNVSNPDSTIYLPNFGLTNSNPCSDPDVSIYAPFLRRCFSNQLVYVSACNQSTATGILNASYVDVELDPLLTVNSATLPFTSQGNNVFRFQTGNLNPGQCVNFNISTTVSCNALSGQTLCMDATLYPIESCALDTDPCDPITDDGSGGTVDGLPEPCSLPWDQSSLTVDGWCQNDSVYFYVENHGSGDMDCYLPVIVYVDGVLTQTDSIQLVSGQSITYVFPAYGETWILNAEQHPLHPGNSHPNAHVEACGDTINFSRDFVNEFPQDDADPVVDIYCGVVTGSYDPNDKTGYPIGQTDQKYIQPNQQLQYVIRFQNTGTDTAFTVVIRDTLDFDLNIFTVTAGVSSHPYTFRMYGPRVLEWTFNNILLPDSTTNSDGSNGFVTFHVDQVPNLSPGTEITNDADIYFDFNDPITTNTTIHRIYEGFVSVLNVEELTQKGKSLLVYPNPTSHSITIKGEKNMNQSFQIFDQMGREVFKGKLNGISTEVNLSSLSKGIYTLKIDGNYQAAHIVKE